MFIRDFLDFNKKIIESIKAFSCNLTTYDSVKVVIADFLLFNHVDECFGDFGHKLKSFILSIDMQHPELFAFLQNALGENGIMEMKEIMEIFKYSKRKKHKLIISRFHKLCENFSANRMFVFNKNLEYLEQAKIHSRFLDEKQRWDVRSRKKVTKIAMPKKPPVVEEDAKTPDAFACYHHNSDRIISVLAHLESKYNTLIDMNCVHMAAEIKETIDKINTDLNSQSLGFHRITLNSVAKNISKISNFYQDVKIHPVTEEMLWTNSSLRDLVTACERFPAFDAGYSVFDHYGIIKADDSEVGIIVGERDTQAFFIGYFYDDQQSQ